MGERGRMGFFKGRGEECVFGSSVNEVSLSKKLKRKKINKKCQKQN